MLLDISIRVTPATPEWPGDTPFSCGWNWAIARGESVNVSTLTMSPHVGTHADAPLHVLDGAAGADLLPLDPFYGPAAVVDVSDASDPLTRDEILARASGPLAPRLLLRTGRTVADGDFPGAWPALSPEAAAALARDGVFLVGVDAPSVDNRDSKTLAVHHALFDSGVCILENLDLREVMPGSYTLVAFPQRLAGLDAAPVRAVLVSHTR